MRSNDFFRILSAEDDFDDQHLMKEAINASGINAEIDFVQDGEALLTKLRSGSRPDIVLLDLNMPKKDGRQALREIKSHPRLKDIPIVVLTTSKAQFDEQQCYQLGANSFISKPHSFKDLVDIIEGLGEFCIKNV